MRYIKTLRNTAGIIRRSLRNTFRHISDRIGRWHVGQLVIAVLVSAGLGAAGAQHFGSLHDEQDLERSRCIGAAQRDARYRDVLNQLNQLPPLDSLEGPTADTVAAVSLGLLFTLKMDLEKLERDKNECRKEHPYVLAYFGLELLSLLLLASVVPTLWIWFGARRAE